MLNKQRSNRLRVISQKAINIGISQRALAKEAGIPESELNRFLNNQDKYFSDKLLDRLDRAFLSIQIKVSNLTKE